jgi:MFS family permease
MDTHEPGWDDPDKRRSVLGLVVAQVAVLSLWFSGSAVLPELAAELAPSETWQALFSAAVQAGFVVGALTSALTGLPDRFDPRRVFFAAAALASAANLALLAFPTGATAIALRLVIGAALAGVYPVGMKLAVGWGRSDRGLLVGLLVGALTLGSASPHAVAAFGGADWRWTIGLTSALALLGGLVVSQVALGPFHATSARFRPDVARKAWTDPDIRLVNLGYLGHMWELYAMWAWLGVALTVSFEGDMSGEDARFWARWATCGAIAVGAMGSVAGGFVADRIGKAEVTIGAMVASGTCALVAAMSFGGPPGWLAAVALVWGLMVIPDSAQFSATIADLAEPDEVGTLLTTQTCLGFGLTFLTVQATPSVAAAVGWPGAFAAMALGPVVGTAAMVRLRRRRVVGR